VPIVGNLKNPKFKLYDVIVDALENTFVKPLTTSYRYEVKNAEMDIEKSLSLKWEMKSSLLTSKQEKFLTRIAYFLDKNPEASITVYPQAYELKEKEYILFYESKKKYVRQLSAKNIRTYGKEDSLKVERLSIKDPLFLEYLNAKVDKTLLFTVQDKCIKLIGASTVDRKFKALNRDRLKVFKAYFKENGTEKRVKIGGKKSVIPYNGFSFYDIHYKGVYPDYLLMAYRNMNKFNHESPRDKFNAERKKIGK